MKRVRSVSMGERMRFERAVDVRVMRREVSGEGELRMSVEGGAPEVRREGSGMLRSVEKREVVKVSRVLRRML
jgi:hypothetical protein